MAKDIADSPPHRETPLLKIKKYCINNNEEYANSELLEANYINIK